MRRVFACTLALPLLLGACSKEGSVTEASPTGAGIPTASAPTTGAASTGTGSATSTDATSATSASTTSAGSTTSSSAGAATSGSATSTDAASTTSGSTTSGSGSTAGSGSVEGGADGQAAADVAKAFFIAMVKAKPEACDYLLSFSDPEKPITSVKSDYELCTQMLPSVLKQEVAKQGLDQEGAAILEAMKITGAHVTGTTAVVDKDNFSKLFAQSIGDEVITLQKVDGHWYIDLNESFKAPSGGR